MLKYKRILSLIMTMAMVLSMLPLQVFAEETEQGGTEENIAVAADEENIAVAAADQTVTLWNVDGVAQVEAVYSEPVECDKDLYFYINEAGVSGQFVLRNVSSDEIWSFQYISGEVENVTLDGDAAFNSGEISLNPNGQVTIGFTMTEQSGWIQFIYFDSKPVADSGIEFLYYDAVGNITVNDTAVSNGGHYDVAAAGATLKATVTQSGANFLGWVDGTTGKLLSSNATYTLIPYDGLTTVKAAFTHADAPAWFKVDGTYYTDDLNTAFTLGGAVTLLSDGTLPAGSYSIPSNKSLHIPYDANGTEPEVWAVPNCQTTLQSITTNKPFRTLTMESGTTLNIQGKLLVNSMVYSYSNLDTTVPIGPYGQIVLNKNAEINVLSGGTLYCYGFITGTRDSQGNYAGGKVNAQAGSIVYELFQARDMPGGSNLDEINTKNKNGNGTVFCFPITQYYVQNIEAKYVIDKGATSNAVLLAYSTSYNMDAYDIVCFIGDGALFTLTGNQSYLERIYDPYADRMIYTVYGNMSVNSIHLSLEGEELDTKNYILAINNNLTIDIASGKTTVNSRIKLLPGAQINVGTNGAMEVASGGALYIYDKKAWHQEEYTVSANESGNNAGTQREVVRYSPTRAAVKSTITAPVYSSAQVKIDGTLTAHGNIFTVTGYTFGSTTYPDPGSMDKVLFGEGTFVNDSAFNTTLQNLLDEPYDGPDSAKYFDTYVKIPCNPVVGMIVDSGATQLPTAYTTFSTGTYQGVYCDTNGDGTAAPNEYFWTTGNIASYSIKVQLMDAQGNDVGSPIDRTILSIADLSGYYTDRGNTAVTKDTLTEGVTVYAYAEASINNAYYQSLEAAVDAAKSGDTVKVLRNAELSSSIVVPSGKTVTLDVGTYTVSCAGTVIINQGTIAIKGNGGVVDNTDTAAKAKLTGEAAAVYNQGTISSISGKLTIQAVKTTGAGVAIVNQNASIGTIGGDGSQIKLHGNYSAMYLQNSSVGTIAAPNGWIHMFSSAMSTIYMNNGQVTAIGENVYINNTSYGAIRMFNGSSVGSINAGSGAVELVSWHEPIYIGLDKTAGGSIGEISGNVIMVRKTGDANSPVAYVCEGGSVGPISGGYFCNADGGRETLFSGNVIHEVLSTDTKTVTTKFDGQKDCYYIATVENPVAEVNGNQFSTLENAVAAAQNGDTVTVLRDIELTSSITIPSGKTLTLNVGTYTVSYPGTVIINNGTLAITGNGGSIDNTSTTAPAKLSNEAAAVYNKSTISSISGKVSIQAVKTTGGGVAIVNQNASIGTIGGEGSQIKLHGNYSAMYLQNSSVGTIAAPNGWIHMFSSAMSTIYMNNGQVTAIGENVYINNTNYGAIRMFNGSSVGSINAGNGTVELVSWHEPIYIGLDQTAGGSIGEISGNVIMVRKTQDANQSVVYVSEGGSVGPIYGGYFYHYGGRDKIFSGSVTYEVLSTDTKVVSTKFDGQKSCYYTAHEHVFNTAPEFVWIKTADGYEASATFICSNVNCPNGTEPISEKADVTTIYTKTDGNYTVKYTATVTINGQTYTDEKTESLIPTETMNLLYDDRKVEENIQILYAGDPTSTKVGSDTTDDAVVIYVDNTLIATGTGEALIRKNGVLCKVTVSAAPISLFMITGHSIGMGSQGDPDESVVGDAGQVYSFHSWNPSTGKYTNQIGDTDGMGLGYASGDNRPYGVDAFTQAGAGVQGEDSALAWKWNQLTKEKVYVVNAAVGGSCLADWAGSDNSLFGPLGVNENIRTQAIGHFTKAQSIISNEVAAGHYELKNMVLIYHNVANFEYRGVTSYTQKQLEQWYADFMGEMRKNLNKDVDGDDQVDEISIGLIPIWETKALEAFTFDAPASMFMGASKEYPDMFTASMIGRDLNSDAKVVGYFGTHKQDYTVQNGTTITFPTTNKGLYADGTHYYQCVYNAMGIDIANNLFARFRSTESTDIPTVTLMKQDGITEVGNEITLEHGEILVPMVNPVETGDLTFTVSGTLRMEYPLAIYADPETADGEGTLTVKRGEDVLKTVTIKVTAPVATASIGDKIYWTLTDAIAEAQSGDTVQLLRDVTLNGSLMIDKNKNLTLDIGGCTLSCNGTVIKNYGTLSIKGSGGTISNTLSVSGSNPAVYNDGTISSISGDLTIRVADHASGGSAIQNYNANAEIVAIGGEGSHIKLVGGYVGLYLRANTSIQTISAPNGSIEISSSKTGGIYMEGAKVVNIGENVYIDAQGQAIQMFYSSTIGNIDAGNGKIEILATGTPIAVGGTSTIGAISGNVVVVRTTEDNSNNVVSVANGASLGPISEGYFYHNGGRDKIFSGNITLADGKELSETTKTVTSGSETDSNTYNCWYIHCRDANHTPAAAVEENRVETTCTVAGSYDKVVYCSACNEELSRETVTVDALGHTYGEPTFTWNATAESATCTATFTCSVCEAPEDGAEDIADRVKTVDCEVTVKDGNRVDATCSADGSVVYTATATVEFGDKNYTSDSDPVVIPELEHSYTGEWVKTEDGHAQKCVNGCNGTDTVVPHTDIDLNNVCDACQYEIPATGGGEVEAFVPTIGNGTSFATPDEHGNVTFKAGTSGPDITVTAPVDGWKLGEENEFTVDSGETDIACVVLVKDGEGNYTRVMANTDEDTGIHSFTTELDEDCEIIIALKGDLNMNGDISAKEARDALQASSGVRELSAIEFAIADLDGNGKISAKEARDILQASSETRDLTW